MLLSDHRAYPTIPAANMGRAKSWYKDKLGLEPAEEHPTGTISTGSPAAPRSSSMRRNMPAAPRTR